MRRPMFQDVRVRKALDLALDFQWLNRQLFFNQYTRIDSFFANTAICRRRAASAGRTGAARAMAQPTRSGGVRSAAEAAGHRSARLAARQSAAGARVVAEAGWTYRDGALRNAQGRAVRSSRFSTILPARPLRLRADRRDLHPQSAEARHHVDVSHDRFRGVSEAARRVRFRHDHIRMPDVQVPGYRAGRPVRQQVRRYARLGQLIGLKSPAVDAILRALVQAQTREQLVDATHALDRVLMHGYYVIPQWYSGSRGWRSSAASRGRKTLPLYYSRGRLDHVDVVVHSRAKPKPQA